MLEEIQTAFGIGPRWDDAFLHDPGCEVHDECLFLKRVCTGKSWGELDQTQLAEAFFTPGLYLTARGLAFIAPALMATALAYPQSGISGHTITSFSPKSDRTAAIQAWWRQMTETHDARQRLCIMNWLSLVNSRDEGLQEWLPAGRLLALMRGGRIACAPTTGEEISAVWSAEGAVIAVDGQSIARLADECPDPCLDGFETLCAGEDVAATLAFIERTPGIESMADEFGTTALIAACMYADLPVVERLCRLGADVNARAETGETPLVNLVRAACVGEARDPLGCARLLLAHGADTDRLVYDGTNALHHAIIHSQVELVLLLLEAGADPSVRLDDGPSQEDAIELARSGRPCGDAQARQAIVDALLRRDAAARPGEP